MEDYIIRATAADGNIRAFAANSTHLVRSAQQLHGLYPVASAALGRTIVAAAMMGIDMKGQRDVLSISLKGGGPLGNVVVVAKSDGKIKGYVDFPQLELPLNSQGKLDVASAIGIDGKLTVIKDLGLKEPYIGQVDLVSGEIAEDIAYYMLFSEQKPSAIGLGVLINPDATVQAAGGFIIQPMPGAPEDLIIQMEHRIAEMPSISSMIAEKKTPEDILRIALGNMDLKIHDKLTPLFYCDCNRERLESVLLTLGKPELEEILHQDGKAELVCHYCNKKYLFNESNLTALIKDYQD